MEKSRQTILEILSDRGYNLDTKVDINEKRFKILQPKVIHVVWTDGVNLSSVLKSMCVEMLSKEYTEAILICDSITPKSKQIIENLAEQKLYIDFYTFEQSLSNISKHHLVPKHEICSKEEIELVCKNHGLKTTDLQIIRSTDPMVKHLGARKGMTIKITGKSNILKGYPVVRYRRVV